MRSRSLNRRIEVWQTITVSDGFSGNKKQPQQIAVSWASISTFDTSSKYARQVIDMGLNTTNGAIKITLRKRQDLDYTSKSMFFVYRNEKYIIHTDPTNNDFDDSFIKLIGVRQTDNSYTEVQPIGEFLFNNYKARVLFDNGTLEAEDCLKSFLE